MSHKPTIRRFPCRNGMEDIMNNAAVQILIDQAPWFKEEEEEGSTSIYYEDRTRFFYNWVNERLGSFEDEHEETQAEEGVLEILWQGPGYYDEEYFQVPSNESLWNSIIDNASQWAW